MIWTIAFLTAFLTTAALAQQGTPEVDALAQKLLAEVSANVNCSTNAIRIQRELDAVKAELAKLKETKPDAKQ